MTQIHRAYLYFITLMIFFTGCSQDAVVFAPTPAPPDLSPLRYSHPSGAFTIDVPRTWSVYEQHAADLATASFTPPESDQPLVYVSVLRLMAEQPITDLINRYQREIRPDVSRYTEQSRQLLDDESWQLVGLRENFGNPPQQLNTFILREPPFFAVTEIVMVDDAPLQRELETIANTVHINLENSLQATELTALGSAAATQIEIVNVTSWTAPTGVYFITGEVTNHGLETVRAVPIRVLLQSEDEVDIAEALDTVMGYGVAPGEFAPFSLRFGQGQPEDATRYSISLGTENWQPDYAPPDSLAGNNDLTWANESTITEEGHLLINGILTNTSSQMVYDPLATVTVFDGNQNVIAARFTPLPAEALAPEETLPFEIRLEELGGAPINYIVNIQALKNDDTP